MKVFVVTASFLEPTEYAFKLSANSPEEAAAFISQSVGLHYENFEITDIEEVEEESALLDLMINNPKETLN